MRKLGYLLVEEISREEHAGALFLVDERGVPLDFLYTLPVRPTRVQKVIYGKALSSYLRGELIPQALVGELKDFDLPSLWLLRDRSLLEGASVWWRKVPAVWISSTSERPLEAVGDLKEVGDEVLAQLDPVSSPYRISSYPPDRRSLEEAVKILCEVSSKVELEEPFLRALEALKIAVQEGGS